MANVRFVPNMAGYKEVMKSGDVISALMEVAQQQASRANGMAQVPGAKYEVANSYVGATRANVSVGATNLAAWEDNDKNHTLSKLVGGS